MDTFEATNRFKLLWPERYNETEDINSFTYSLPFAEDLGIDQLGKAFSMNSQYTIDTEKLLSYMSSSSEVISYRLDVLDDLAANSNVAECMRDMLPTLEELGRLSSPVGMEGIPLLQTVWRLGALDLYVKCVNNLIKALDNSSLKSEALISLREKLKKISFEDNFKTLAEELPRMRSGFERLASVTVGLNLDAQLKPVEAVILSINDQCFKGQSMMGRLLGKKDAPDEYQGISALMKIEKVKTNHGGAYKQYANNPFHVALFNELNNVLGAAAKPVAAALNKFIGINASILVDLADDIKFYMGALKLCRLMKSAGMPLCRARLAAPEERVFCVQGLYNINLALQMHYRSPDEDISSKIVPNDVDFGSGGTIFILTGPNQGGKTTYIQALGLAQALFQLGMYVPGTDAVISPVDGIYTHFPVEERPDSNMGRLGEESQRLHDIFGTATSKSLILLNESIHSTSPSECLYISREVMFGLKLLGARAVFATHLHELARNLDGLNKHLTSGGRFVSLVSGIAAAQGAEGESSAIKRTYIIKPGPPQGSSYARDIAARYGLSLDNIVHELTRRNILDKSIDAGSLCEIADAL